MATDHDTAESPQGPPAVDPSRNVLDLVEEAIKRQDDLRVSSDEVAKERYVHIKELLALRAEFYKDIRILEAERHKNDVDRAQLAVQALAAQTAADRETLRTQSTATVDQLIARIAQLEKTSYEGKGKEAVADPAMTLMVTELKALRTEMATATGKGQGYENVWGWVVAAAGSGGVLAWIASHYAN